MKRAVFIFLVLCILALPFAVRADAASATPLNDFEHTRKAADTLLLTKYTGRSATVTVPESYLLDGVNCKVELASGTVFAGNTSLTSVTVSKGVSFENNSMTQLFAKCEALRTVKIQADTADVTDMSFLFYGCEALEKLDLSAFNTENVTTMQAMFSHCSNLKKLTGYETWNTGSLRAMDYMFDRTEKLKTVDLSQWRLEDLENSGWCFQYCGASKIRLPDDLAVISAGFLNHASKYAGGSFTIPAGVEKIGYAHTIYDFATDDFTQFRVAEGNTEYKAVDGILYSADGREMLAIPRGKEFPDGVYEIPEGVTFLGELSFSRNYNVETVILPDSYKLKYIQRYDPAYILFEDTGNLNAGLNLHIAIYCYTGVTAYQVKDSNPNYQSIDGVLYTEDGAALLAVPTRYEGVLTIPEGVVRWEQDAMWDAGDLTDTQLKNLTGVNIPASMTDISADQLEKLNRLEQKNSKFKITVSEENPVYYVGKSGQLLKRHNMEDLQISLAEEPVVYDGQPKMPEPILTRDGKTLTPGKDYTVSYFENVNAGTGWMRITGQGDHYGMAEYAFTIEKAKPACTLPEGCAAAYGQTLKEIPLPEGFSWMQPELSVGEPGTKTFAASYTNNDPNYMTLTDIPVTVTVQPKVITREHVRLAIWQPWTGKAATPAVSVEDNGAVVSQEEYTVSYQHNVALGKAQVVLTDRPGGNYTVNATAEFYILPDPFVCLIALTFLWYLTTGVSITRKDAPSGKPPKSR